MTELKRICSKAGCGELVPIRARYCEKHQAEAKARANDRPWRPPSSQRGYDSQWRKVRAAVLADYPYCQKCKRIRATEVHHLISLSAGGTHDRSNLVALCKTCHTVITNKSR